MSWSHILVPTDFSAPAEAALALALELARQTGARVTLLHAFHVEIPASVPPTGGGFRMPAHVSRELREQARDAIERIARQHAGSGLRVEGRAVEAPPSRAIVDAVRELGADLIVMGTRGRGGVARALLGSVAARVLRRAPCPVMTVRG